MLAGLIGIGVLAALLDIYRYGETNLTPSTDAPKDMGDLGFEAGHYLSPEELLRSTDEAPERIPTYLVEYEGVNLEIMGVLHGVKGGPEAYKRVVERTISDIPSPVLCEKGLQRLYGAGWEIPDWMAMTKYEAFLVSIALIVWPLRLVGLALSRYRERFEGDRFGANGLRRLQDLGRSLHWHRLDPLVRRRLVGLPDPDVYLRVALDRRFQRGGMRSIELVDPQWRWTAAMEPFAAIPLRSLFMLEYAVAWAKSHGSSRVAVVVGDLHLIDLLWFAKRGYLDGLDLGQQASTVLLAAQAEAAADVCSVTSRGAGRDRFWHVAVGVIGSIVAWSCWLCVLS